MRGTTAGGDDREPGGQGLYHRHSQGLRGRREEKGVCGGVGGRELFPLQEAREDRRGARELAFEVPACWPVANYREAGPRNLPQYCLEASDTLLAGQATDVDQELLRRLLAGEFHAPLLG